MRENGPNILVTGTPGVGKTTLCQRIAADYKFRHLNIADLIKEKELHSGWDEEMQCSIYDENKLHKELSNLKLTNGGYLLDFHSVDGIDEDDIDHVVVLTTDISVLCNRLKQRNYTDKKIDGNIEAEIFRICAEDAVEAFGEDKVKEFPHNNEEDSKHVEEYIKSLTEPFHS